MMICLKSFSDKDDQESVLIRKNIFIRTGIRVLTVIALPVSLTHAFIGAFAFTNVAEARGLTGSKVYAKPGAELILCTKAESTESCAKASRAQALGWSRSCKIISGPLDFTRRCQWDRLQVPNEYKSPEFAACKDVMFVPQDRITKMIEKERKQLEQLAACHPRIQILPEANQFFGPLSTQLHQAVRVKNEAETMLQMGITAAEKTLYQLQQAGKEMQKTACCFQAATKGNSFSEGKLNNLCQDRIGTLIDKDPGAKKVGISQFCQNRIEGARKKYKELVLQFRHELIRTGSRVHADMQEFNYFSNNVDQHVPGMHMNLGLKEKSGTITPGPDKDNVIGLFNVGRSKMYSPISDEEKRAAIQDEKDWLAEIDKQWEADATEHNKMLIPRLAQIARKSFSHLPLKEGIEKARYVYMGFFPDSPRRHAFEFLKDARGRPPHSSVADSESYYEQYVRKKIKARRRAHEQNFQTLLGQAPIFAFLAKDNPSDQEIANALFRVVHENNHPMQEEFNKKLIKAKAEIKRTKREGGDPDPFLAADFLVAQNIFEEMLEQKPEMCAAATALQKYVHTKQTSKNLRLGLLAAGATLVSGFGAGVVLGWAGASTTVVAGASTGVGLAGGAVIGGVFLARDMDRVAAAERAFFSVDGISTRDLDVSSPGTLEAIQNARNGELISALTIIFPWDVAYVASAVALARAARQAGLAGFRSGAATASAVAKQRMASFGHRLASMKLRLTKQDRRAIMHLIKSTFFGQRTPIAAELVEVDQIMKVLLEAKGANRILPDSVVDPIGYEKAFAKVGELFRKIKKSPGFASTEDIINVFRQIQDPADGFPITSLNVEHIMNGIEGGIRLGMDPKTIRSTLKEFDTWAQNANNYTHLKGLSKVFDDAYDIMQKRYGASIGEAVPPFRRDRNIRAFTEKQRATSIDEALVRNNVPVEDVAQLRTCVMPGV